MKPAEYFDAVQYLEACQQQADRFSATEHSAEREDARDTLKFARLAFDKLLLEATADERQAVSALNAKAAKNFDHN